MKGVIVNCIEVNYELLYEKNFNFTIAWKILWWHLAG